MFRAVYLIGPSQVGKSSAADQLASRGEIEHIDLDRLLAGLAPERPLIEAAQDWPLVRAALDDLDGKAHATPTVVTVGAGTQDLDRRHGRPLLTGWLAKRTCKVLLVMDDADALFARNPNHRESRSRFDDLEFGSERRRLYEVAGTSVSIAGLDAESAIARVASHVLALASASRASASRE